MSFDILLSPPDVGELEQEYVMRALKSGWVAPVGPDLDAFEGEIAERTGRTHAVGLSSGTAALHLALITAGVGEEDIVLVPTFTFAATANAVTYVGARPHFVDCDPDTGNVSPDLVKRAVTDLRAAGHRVTALVAVDMLGKCADYTRLAPVCAEQDLLLISDAAESLGAAHEGSPAGSHGVVSILSFNGNKVMTTSGGGMLLTDDDGVASHARKLSTQAREPVLHYEHTEVGYNYRLSNLLAALGRAQLARLDSMIARRRAWREGYRQLFSTIEGAAILGGSDDAEDNCWLTAVLLDEKLSPSSAAVLGEQLRGQGIETRPVWKPMHLQPLYRDHSATLDGSAGLLFDRGLTLPSGSGMSESQFAHVVETVQRTIV